MPVGVSSVTSSSSGVFSAFPIVLTLVEQNRRIFLALLNPRDESLFSVKIVNNYNVKQLFSNTFNQNKNCIPFVNLIDEYSCDCV